MIEAVLFDLGDTLFRLDPMADVTGEYAGTLAAEGVEDAETEAARIIGTLRERLAAGYGRGQLEEPSISELVQPFIGKDARSAAMAQALDRLLGVADVVRWERPEGREAVLEALRGRGIRLGFVSNTLTAPELMRQRLEEFGLLRYAAVAVFSVEHRVRKPNPEIYRIALRELGVEPERVVFVGDRVREDVLGPKSLGMRAALTHEFRREDPGAAGPIAVLSKLSDLPTLLEDA